MIPVSAGFAPGPDPRAVRAGLEQELALLNPRISAMQAVAEKMSFAANLLHTVSTAAIAQDTPESAQWMPDQNYAFFVFMRDSQVALVKSQMVITESHLTNLSFQLETFLRRKQDIENQLAQLGNKIVNPSSL